MILESYIINIDIAQKRAKGAMCISPDKDSENWVVVEYECDLVTYHQPAEYCDGYLVHGAADICENAENVRYSIVSEGNNTRSYENVQDMIAEYVVQKANYPKTPDLFTYKKGAA